VSRRGVALARVAAGLVAFGVAGLVVFLAVIFYAFLYGEHLGTGNMPLASACVNQPDSVCTGWTAPAGVDGWVPWFAVQVAMLTVMVLAVACGVWLWRRRPLCGSWQVAFKPRTLAAALLILVGAATVLDLGVYVHFWYEWTGLPADARVGPDRSLGSAVAEGLVAAIPLVVAAAWGAVTFIQRERRDQTGGASS
jgi:hypothetical protein